MCRVCIFHLYSTVYELNHLQWSTHCCSDNPRGCRVLDHSCSKSASFRGYKMNALYETCYTAAEECMPLPSPRHRFRCVWDGRLPTGRVPACRRHVKASLDLSRPAAPGGPCSILEDWALPNEEQSTKREMTGVRQHAADRNVRRD